MLNAIYSVVILFFSIMASYYLTPFFIDVFLRGNTLQKNFKGESIPQGMGIVFVLYSLIWYIVYLLFFNMKSQHQLSFEILIMMIALFAASFIGFIDDILGGRETLGFKGHFGALFRGRLTTGALKAIVGLLIAFVVSLFLSKVLVELVVNTFVIALFTNLLNLMDLRPGRAIKFYMILLAIFALDAVFTGKILTLLLFIPLIGSVTGYFPFDLKAKCMMGDAGSNVLGVSAGIFAALQFNIHEKLAVLLFLMAVNLFAEKYSISDVINRNRFLRYLDNLGRQV